MPGVGVCGIVMETPILPNLKPVVLEMTLIEQIPMARMIKSVKDRDRLNDSWMDRVAMRSYYCMNA